MSGSDLKKVGLVLLLGFTPAFLILSTINLDLIPLFIMSLVAGLVLFFIGRGKEQESAEEFDTLHPASLRRYSRYRRQDSRRQAGLPPYLYPGNILVGRYRIQRHIKKGGMAIVVLATDIDTGSLCMIKVPRHDTRHDPAINAEKLELESAVLSQLNHPNIVKYLDMFVYEGLPHLVVEYLEGENLFDLFSKKPAEERRVIRWGEQILSALEHMHNHGFVHRDVNPSNIMLTRDDNAVIIDFGTTKPVESSGSTMVKTPGFEVPEMVATGYADERSDLFGAGGTLFFLLTCTPPGSIGNRNVTQILLNKGVSARTAWCITQALQVDPGLRFESAAAMRRALCGV